MNTTQNTKSLTQAELSAAVIAVYAQRGADHVACPVCGYESKGRLMMNGFADARDARDTRIGAIFRHIKKAHS